MGLKQLHLVIESRRANSYAITIRQFLCGTFALSPKKARTIFALEELQTLRAVGLFSHESELRSCGATGLKKTKKPCTSWLVASRIGCCFTTTNSTPLKCARVPSG